LFCFFEILILILFFKRYEAFIGCAMYTFYVFLISMNKYLMRGFYLLSVGLIRTMPSLAPYFSIPDEPIERNLVEEVKGVLPTPPDYSTPVRDEIIPEDHHQLDDGELPQARNRHKSMTGKSDEHLVKHQYPTTNLGWVWYFLVWPYQILFRYTIPPSRGKYKYQFFASFAAALVWLAIVSYFMVHWSERIGCTLHIDEAIMGISVLALGTSMPDCLSSIFVARAGEGQMAVSNALVCIFFVTTNNNFLVLVLRFIF
jgi:hypothetical protein